MSECVTGDGTLYFQGPVFPSGFEVQQSCTVIAPWQTSTGEVETLICPNQAGGFLVELNTDFVKNLPIKWGPAPECNQRAGVTCGCNTNDLSSVYKCGRGGNSNIYKVWVAHLNACEGNAKCSDQVKFGRGRKDEAWNAIASEVNNLCNKKATFGSMCSSARGDFQGSLGNIKFSASISGETKVVNNDGRTCSAPWSTSVSTVFSAGGTVKIPAICMGKPDGGSFGSLKNNFECNGRTLNAQVTSRGRVCPNTVGKVFCCEQKNITCTAKPSVFREGKRFSRGAACTVPTPRTAPVLCNQQNEYMSFDKPAGLPGTLTEYCELNDAITQPGIYRQGATFRKFEPRASVAGIMRAIANVAAQGTGQLEWAAHGASLTAAAEAEAACGGPTQCDMTAFKGLTMTGMNASIAPTDEEVRGWQID